ncbi:hypothetical protein QYF36_024298 [Acer negundo]|nr:hypothetical protein QYF36_024298 [Acer negundo]
MCTGNFGNLPLCEESDSPFEESSLCSTYGEAYASLSMAVNFWERVRELLEEFGGSLSGVRVSNVCKHVVKSWTLNVDADAADQYVVTV